MNAICDVHGAQMPCEECRLVVPYKGPLKQSLVLYQNGDSIEFSVRNGLVARCVSAIANANMTDAKWAVEVLNRFGHLVKHESF